MIFLRVLQTGELTLQYKLYELYHFYSVLCIYKKAENAELISNIL